MAGPMTDYCDKCGQMLPKPAKRLTSAELDALSAWFHAGSAKAAAVLLGVIEQTVKNQLYRARIRHDVHRTADLVVSHLGELRSLDELRRSHNLEKGKAA
jgi:hypothetical protein